MVEKFYALGHPAVITNLHSGRYLYIDPCSWEKLENLGVFSNYHMSACFGNLQKDSRLWEILPYLQTFAVGGSSILILALGKSWKTWGFFPNGHMSMCFGNLQKDYRLWE